MIHEKRVSIQCCAADKVEVTERGFIDVPKMTRR